MMSEKKFGSIRQKRENCWEGRYSVNGEKHSFTRTTEAACRRELERIRMKSRGAYLPYPVRHATAGIPERMVKNLW